MHLLLYMLSIFVVLMFSLTLFYLLVNAFLLYSSTSLYAYFLHLSPFFVLDVERLVVSITTLF